MKEKTSSGSKNNRRAQCTPEAPAHLVGRRNIDGLHFWHGPLGLFACLETKVRIFPLKGAGWEGVAVGLMDSIRMDGTQKNGTGRLRDKVSRPENLSEPTGFFPSATETGGKKF